MNTEHISDALNLLDDDLLDEANGLRNGKKRPGMGRAKWLTAAACLALAVCAGAGLLHTGRGLPKTETIDLPKLPLSEEVTKPNGMGFEGYMAFDSSELVNANPWTQDAKLSSLPVYRNLAPLDPAGVPKTAPNPDQIREKLWNVAARLGLDPDSLELEEEPDMGAGFIVRAEEVCLRA